MCIKILKRWIRDYDYSRSLNTGRSAKRYKVVMIGKKKSSGRKIMATIFSDERLLLDKWLLAENKHEAHDRVKNYHVRLESTSDYSPGFHVFITKENAKKYCNVIHERYSLWEAAFNRLGGATEPRPKVIEVECKNMIASGRIEHRNMTDLFTEAYQYIKIPKSQLYS